MREHARSWIARWDAQQEFYVPHRETLFGVIADALVEVVDKPDPLVLDLGCGPGSLAVRLRERLPKARIVAVDTNPLLLGLAQAAYADTPELRFVSADLARPDWTAVLDLDGPVDAAVSTTALHWLPEDRLRAAYAELHSVLAPGAVFLDGDHLTAEDFAPTLARVHAALGRSTAEEPRDNWEQWWDAIAQDPTFGELVKPRAGHDPHTETQGLRTHVNALTDAGFAEIDTIWQHGDSRVLAAIR
ncbi:methyltransferase domain-containing protein [Actinokineospora auranticolor]|uniref:Methyltransferase family protein n=1 Tax=Actinokineospora auranticolor TaxID=155976 RepID=A0A2S6GTG5_9PSEU|nr:class I SAM-dependent methyltransferase [Actinokineospora auranticolor]PPK68545.1 methyltransferase family protein [Actinokineospora auranticolor]